MQMQKKRILKEDGRYLVYYHFVESATAEQTAAFAEVVPAEEEAKSAPAETAATVAATGEGAAHV